MTRPRSSSTTYSNYTGNSRPNSQIFSESFELPLPPPLDETQYYQSFEPANYGPQYATETGETLQPLHHQFNNPSQGLWHPIPQYPPPSRPYSFHDQQHPPNLPPLTIDQTAPHPSFDPYEVSPEHHHHPSSSYPSQYPNDSRFVSPIDSFDSQQHSFLYSHPSQFDNLHPPPSLPEPTTTFSRPPRSASSSNGGSSRRGSVAPLQIHPRHLTTLDEQFGDGGPTPRASDFESSSSGGGNGASQSVTDQWGNVVSPPYSSPSVTSPQDSGYAASNSFLPLSGSASATDSRLPDPPASSSSSHLYPPQHEQPLSTDSPNSHFYDVHQSDHLRPHLTRRGTAPTPGGLSPLESSASQSSFQSFPPSQSRQNNPSPLYHPQPQSTNLPFPSFDTPSPASSHASINSSSNNATFPPLSTNSLHRHSLSSASTSSFVSSSSIPSHPSSPDPSSTTATINNGQQKVYPSPVIGGLAAKWEGLKINTDVGPFGSATQQRPTGSTAAASQSPLSDQPGSAVGLAIDENGRATLTL